MLNFTGSTNKRTVNLGNRRKVDRTRFLEQSKIDREQRERQREHESRGAIIAVHVRNFLEFSTQAQNYVDSWLSEFDLSTDTIPNTSYDVSSERICAFKDWRHWCCQFRFVTRLGLRRNLDLALLVLDYISRVSEANPGSMEFSDFDLCLLIRGMNKAKDRGISSEEYLQGMHNIFHNLRTLNSYQLPLTSTLKKLSECLTEHNFMEILHIAFYVNIADSKVQFFLFFAALPPKKLHNIPEYADLFYQAMTLSMTEIYRFPPLIKVAILENMVALLSISTKKDLLSFCKFISTMNFHLIVSQESEELAQTETVGNVIPDVASNSRSNPYTSGLYQSYSMEFMLKLVKSYGRMGMVMQNGIPIIFITQEVESRLNTLCSHSFISRCHTLKSTNPTLHTTFMSHLLHVFHQSKASICMIMAATPKVVNSIFENLKTHPVFYEMKGISTGRETCPKSDWARFLEPKNGLFWDTVYLYEQFLSYWLIASKFPESLEDRILKKADLREFCSFLKTLCLTLIFENTNFIHIQRIKELSFSLLNQLHRKNLRFLFLDRDFWKLKFIKMDFPRLLPAILNDAELDESDYSSEDESTYGIQRRQAPRRISDTTNKLEIIKKLPFFIDFKDRVVIFQALIHENQNSLGTNTLFFSDELNSHHVQLDINRDTLFEDAFDELSQSGPDLRNKWKVSFYNAHGPEAGIDGGGLTKELLTSIVREATKSKEDNGLALFKETETYEYYPNDETYLKLVSGIDLPQQKRNLAYYEFLGMVIGKCLYESVLIDVKFAPFFLSKWKINQKTMKSSISDLYYVDSSVYQNLHKLMFMSAGAVSDLALDFTVNEVLDGKVREFGLLPVGDSKQPIDIKNRLTYVYSLVDFKLNKSIDVQTRHFLNGLYRIIKPNWLNMFNPFELQMLIGGVNDINIDDWKRNVSYGGYFDDDLTIKLFWEVVAEMSSEERCQLVKFVTSVARAPLLGFRALYPIFGINNSGSPDRLPTASTCHNLLKLPDYKDKQLLRDKLLYALHANSGFDLS